MSAIQGQFDSLPFILNIMANEWGEIQYPNLKLTSLGEALLELAKIDLDEEPAIKEEKKEEKVVQEVWENYLTELTMTKVLNSYPAFSPRKPLVISMLSAYHVFVRRIVDAIEAGALVQRKKISLSPVFRIKAKSSIDELHKSLLVTSSEADKQIMQDITETTGLSGEEYNRCVNQARNITQNFFNANDEGGAFKYSVTPEDLKAWKFKTEILMSNYACSYYTKKDSKQEIRFEKQDLKIFKIAKKDITADPSTITCLSFTLLKIKELKAKEIIFQKKERGKLENIFKLLTKWNYKAIKTPTENDLVIYVDGNNEPQHVAYCTSPGWVRSKPAILISHSYEHRLFDIDPTYGKRAVFFRKPQV